MYISDSIKNLLTRTNNRKILIFIDEFEEMLNYNNEIKLFLSGLKETINGNYKPIHENGQFEGALHFVLCCTPDAYYRIQRDNDLNLIWGSLGRRIGTIELPVVPKIEGITFLYDLLRFSYENNLPNESPISSIGVLYSIYKVSNGNPGSMVSLLSKLMNGSIVEDKFKVIDYKSLIEFLSCEKTNVFGAESTRCLDLENYKKIIDLLSSNLNNPDKGLETFNLFVGESFPFTIDDVSKRINIPNTNFLNIIENINVALKNKMAINCGILKMNQLDNFDKFKEKFKEFIKIEDDKEFLEIDGLKENIKIFEERILFKISEEKTINLLPSNESSIRSFFEEALDSDRIKEINYKINSITNQAQTLYLISDEVLSQIYPVPVPPQLNYIIDRIQRFKIWKEIKGRIYEEAYQDKISLSFLDILDNTLATYANLNKIKESIYKFDLAFDNLNIKSLLIWIKGDVKRNDIEEVYKLSKNHKDVRLIILLNTSELSEDTIYAIKEKQIGIDNENPILNITINQTILKRILVSYLAKKNDYDIESDYLKNEYRDIINDLNFENLLRNWIFNQTKKGIVIQDLSLKYVNSKDLVGALKFFINVNNESLDLEKILEKNRKEILKFFTYGGKGKEVIADIESKSQLERASVDLISNGFLEKEQNEYYKVILHPIENRLLKILESRKEAFLLDEISKYFIKGAKNERLLEEVYLRLLEYKGTLFKNSQNFYGVRTIEEINNSINNSISRLNDEKSLYSDYGYFYVTKQREERFFTLNEFINYIQNL